MNTSDLRSLTHLHRALMPSCNLTTLLTTLCLFQACFSFQFWGKSARKKSYNPAWCANYSPQNQRRYVRVLYRPPKNTVDSLESTVFSFSSTHFSTHLPIFFVSRAPNPCTHPDSLPLVHPSFQHPDDIWARSLFSAGEGIHLFRIENKARFKFILILIGNQRTV